MNETTAPSRVHVTALAIAIAALLAASGAVAVMRVSDQASPALERLVPAEAVGLLRVSLRPSRDQRQALDDLLDRVGEAQREQISDGIASVLDGALEPLGLRWRADVEPWVGAQVVIAAMSRDLGPPEPIGLLAVRDDAAAAAALERARDRAGFAFLIEDGVATVAKETKALESFTAASKRGPSIVDTGPYQQGLAEVGGDLLAFGYGDVEALAKGFPGAGFAAPQARGSTVLGLRAESDALILEMAADVTENVPEQGEFDLLRASPADILGAFGLFDPAAMLSAAAEAAGDDAVEQVREALQPLDLDLEDDLLPWLGDEVAVMVRGVAPVPEVAVVIGSTDDEAAARTMRAFLENADQIGLSASGSDEDLTLNLEGFEIFVRRVPGRVVIATTRAYANDAGASAGDSLAEDAVYRRAVTPGKASSIVFLRIDRLRALLATLLPPGQRTTYDQDIEPLLRPFQALGVQQSVEGDRFRLRVRLTAE